MATTKPSIDVNDPAHFERLKPEEKTALAEWIALTLTKGPRRHSLTSYGLKHVFEKAGFYVTNGQFKGAMLAAGHEPIDPKALNWSFRVKSNGKLSIW